MNQMNMNMNMNQMMSNNNNNMNQMNMNMNQMMSNNINNMNQMLPNNNNNMNQMNMMMNQMLPNNINGMNQMIMANQINSLVQKNKSLEKKLNDLETKFQEYQNKIEAILFYNEIDPNIYTLDIIFNNLPSKEIIKNKHELRMINKGIKDIFNKNILCLESKFKYKYKSEFDNFNPSQFKQIFDSLKYSLLIICTKNREKRFGAFYNNGGLMMEQGMNSPMVNPDDIGIFDSRSSINDYFTFSLDNLKIYYKRMNGNTIPPDFYLIYNNRYESLLGSEFENNNNRDLGFNAMMDPNQGGMNNNIGMNSMPNINNMVSDLNNMNNNNLNNNMNNMNNNNEYNISNNNMNMNINMNNMMNNQNIQNNFLNCKLSGDQEFKVKSLELYEILI